MLGKWWKRPKVVPEVQFGPLEPEGNVIAIGDIHGRFDLLNKFAATTTAAQIICLGDMIDRGEQSADVLRTLHELPDVISLMGNHEDMMLQFIVNPVEKGERWLRHGGLQTLASFGVSGVSQTSTGGELERARDKLFAAMGEDLIDWVANLPKYWTSGNVAFVHAGADPLIAIEEQENRTLLWGHKDFGRVPRADGMWVVHGHTIVDTPVIRRGVVSIDTGAYATGNLTAATILKGDVSFTYA
ncbi:metallophosphoesterase [Roseobacter sp. GAI101]|uniref:metallophosphoesterase n=1 Tax=Roseobacter sp. (strain GAI101) TaxID=391589 RepID=UPI0001871FE2|nr:metallophosphoesterase [Roseobacter sp. GAI101]